MIIEWTWILLGIIIVIVLAIVLIYNNLVSLRNRVENAWSQINVQLKRRYDLIPNLVETVRGYMKHEREVLTEITKARAAMGGAKTMRDQARASNMLTSALKTLFAVAENYPQLKANENFKLLQEQLEGTENKIAYSRQFYNDSVQEFNIAIQTFPGNVFASMFRFLKKEFFEAPAGERANVKVKF